MKRFWAILFSFVIFSSLQANEDDDSTSYDGVVLYRNSSSNNPRRVPSKSEIILLLEDGVAHICFRGDYGIGHYQLIDLTSGDVIWGDVDTSSISEELVNISNFEGDLIDFCVSFDNGRSCHLTFAREIYD